jgi:hypothetical protein
VLATQRTMTLLNIVVSGEDGNENLDVKLLYRIEKKITLPSNSIISADIIVVQVLIGKGREERGKKTTSYVQ